MTRTTNAILALVGLITLLYLVFRTPAAQKEVVNAFDSVTDSLQNLYVLYFEPIKESKTVKEAEEMKKNLDELVTSYQSYVEDQLGNKVKHRYDNTIHGLSIQLDQTQKLLTALGRKYTGKASKGEEITVDKLYELLYKLKGENFKKWGIKMKLEKDKKMFSAF